MTSYHSEICNKKTDEDIHSFAINYQEINVTKKYQHKQISRLRYIYRNSDSCTVVTQTYLICQYHISICVYQIQLDYAIVINLNLTNERPSVGAVTQSKHFTLQSEVQCYNRMYWSAFKELSNRIDDSLNFRLNAFLFVYYTSSQQTISGAQHK